MKARELSQEIYYLVVRNVEAIYPQFMKRVNDIDIDYFEDITRDSEYLPEELNFELRDKVLDDIRQYAIQLLEETNIKGQIAAIMQDADEATAKETLVSAREEIRHYVYSCSILNGSSDVTEEELQQKYTDAKKRNIWEIITQSNKADVIAFHHALMDKTYEQCKDVLYTSIDSFFRAIETAIMATKDIKEKEEKEKEKKKKEEQTYRCNDCGNTIYKHEVFC